MEKTYRVLKNIMGLWLIQECKRCWDNQKQEFTFPEIVKMAEQSEPFKSLVDPEIQAFDLIDSWNLNTTRLLQKVINF